MWIFLRTFRRFLIEHVKLSRVFFKIYVQVKPVGRVSIHLEVLVVTIHVGLEISFEVLLIFAMKGILAIMGISVCLVNSCYFVDRKNVRIK